MGFHDSPPDFDLGSGHVAWKSVWDPDLDLNPQYRLIAAVLPLWIGLIVSHTNPHTGQPCHSGITFNLPVLQVAGVTFGGDAGWDVESWDPLTLSPSLLCKAYNVSGDPASGTCDDHGFIRGGLWVSA